MGGFFLRLNRTSVGLKLTSSPARFARSISPQSNQRGIETNNQGASDVWLGLSLNRTSVGLKRAATVQGRRPWRLPQSNQRGIETIDTWEQDDEITVSLNRTSVGLKRSFRSEVCRGARCLNRTSVGLKPNRRARLISLILRASIEPAWD